MKKIFVLLISLSFVACRNNTKETATINTDTYYASEFFHEVQMQQIFPDGKTFVDYVPKKTLTEILAGYDKKKNEDDFDLKTFVEANFDAPVAVGTAYESNKTKSMEEHLLSLWQVLTRQPDDKNSLSSLIPLPNKYVVPGGRFREIYYWDSYFTIEGLRLSNPELAENMVDNFAFLIDSIGFIPNGNRNYYLTRSQPPFFALMVAAISKDNEEKLLKYLPALEKEYAYWMQDNKLIDINGKKYNRYFDLGNTPRPESHREDFELAQKLGSNAEKETLYRNLRTGAMSGWDYSTRWFADNKNLSSIEILEIIPVDLNCLLYALEDILAKAFEAEGSMTKMENFEAKAKSRKANIQNLFWNTESKFFEDYNFAKKAHTNRKTLAGSFPLFLNLATKEQAGDVQKTLINEFLKPGGFVTSLQNSGQQWDAPNGWAPLQYVTIEGLNNYGYADLAKKSAKRWLNLNRKIFNNTGKMMEKYNVMDTSLVAGGGEYPNQDGFGWTNGVALKLLEKYK
jgi:alpha,alpha-trehalase